MKIRNEKIDEEKLTQLVKTLEDGDSFEKEKAIETLVAMPDKEIVTRVIPLLDDQNTLTRMAAWEILKNIGHYDIEAVLDLLESDSEDIRVYAAEIVGALKDSSALPRLIKKIYDVSPNVRNIACIALGAFEDETAVDALLEKLEDDPWIAFSAIESLGKIGNKKAVTPLLHIFNYGSEEVSIAAAEVLMGFHNGGVHQEVFDILKGWDSEKRSPYIDVIINSVNDEIFEAMKVRMGNEVFEHLLRRVRNDPKRNMNLLRLLSRFQRKEAGDAILEVLSGMEYDEEEYPEVLEIFAGMCDIWKNDVMMYIEKDEQYILPIIKGCKAAGLKIEEGALLKTFRMSTVEVKRIIVKNLTVLLEGDGQNMIREAMEDTDGHVKGDAFVAAGIMSMKSLQDKIVDSALKGFLDVRIKALKALMKLDPELGLSLIDDFVEQGSLDDKRLYLAVAKYGSADKNYPFVSKLLSDPNEKIRRAVIDIIGQFLDDERYMTIFAGLLMGDDIPHEALKVAKEKRLVAFKDRLKEVFQEKDGELWTRYYALTALNSFEDPSLFETFIQGLKDDNNIIKIGSIKALAELNDPRALLPIAPFSESEDEDIRSAAEAALSRLENIGKRNSC